MHQISQEAIELSKKHAQQLQEHGARLIETVESLSKDEHPEFDGQKSEFLIRAGHQIQVFAQEMLSLIDIIESNSENSIDAYTAAVRIHTEATNLEIQASRTLQNATLKAVDRRLHQLNDRSANHQHKQDLDHNQPS